MKTEINKKEPLVFHFDDFVIGGTLEALFFSYTFSFPLIYTVPVIPYPFEKHSEAGNKKDLWDNLHMLMALAGKIPFLDNCKKIKYVDSETLKVVNNRETVFYVKFKKLWIFDDLDLFDLPITNEGVDEYQIIDRFRVMDNWNPEILDIFINSQTINSMHFYKKEEHSKKHKYKNLYVITTVEPLKELPPYHIRIRAEQHLGCKRLEHIDRIYRATKLPYNDDFDNVVFCYAKFEEMYPFSHKRKKITYQKYLKLKLKL